jgi:hypothetical protein
LIKAAQKLVAQFAFNQIILRAKHNLRVDQLSQGTHKLERLLALRPLGRGMQLWKGKQFQLAQDEISAANWLHRQRVKKHKDAVDLVHMYQVGVYQRVLERKRKWYQLNLLQKLQF